MMLIGAMNHPRKDVIEEIRWMADLGLGFIDLTLEPPAAASWLVDPEKIRKEIEDRGLEVVGHTAFYLPIDSPFEEVRQASLIELKRCLDVFSKVGVEWMNVHPGRYTPMHDREFFVRRDIESLKELIEYGAERGVGVMVENLPGDFNTAEELADLLDPLPDLGLHLDIGHANLMVPYNTTEEVLDRLGHRLKHVHLHDNKGGRADLHLPLGVGKIDVDKCVRCLKECGYDDTITLEVFSEDHAYLKRSMEVLQETWARVHVEKPTREPASV